jgi:hypothetical protein
MNENVPGSLKYRVPENQNCFCKTIIHIDDTGFKKCRMVRTNLKVLSECRRDKQKGEYSRSGGYRNQAKANNEGYFTVRNQNNLDKSIFKDTHKENFSLELAQVRDVQGLADQGSFLLC